MFFDGSLESFLIFFGAAWIFMLPFCFIPSEGSGESTNLYMDSRTNKTYRKTDFKYTGKVPDEPPVFGEYFPYQVYLISVDGKECLVVDDIEFENYFVKL